MQFYKMMVLKRSDESFHINEKQVSKYTYERDNIKVHNLHK